MKAFNIKWVTDDDTIQKTLPNEVEIPEELTNDDEISDYLSNTYGFLHEGFELDSDNNATDHIMRYIDRDISWVSFNDRIIDLASLDDVPLVERFRFINIADSNLMEFMKVRMSKLYNKITSKENTQRITGLSTDITYEELKMRVTHQMLFIESVKQSLIDLRDFGFYRQYQYDIVGHVKDKYQLKALNEYNRSIKPLITPIFITDDPHERTTNIVVDTVYLIFKLKKGNRKSESYVLVSLPPADIIDYIIPIDCGIWVMTTDMIVDDIVDMYTDIGWRVVNIASFRVCNNCDIPVKESNDILHEMEKVLSRRSHSEPIMVQYENYWAYHSYKDSKTASERDIKQMLSNVDATRKMVINLCNTSMDMYDLSRDWIGDNGFGSRRCLGTETFKSMIKVWTQVSESIEPKERLSLLYPKMMKNLTTNSFKKDKNIFESIRNRDILLVHPYDSFDIVVEFIKSAAKDKSVISIRQTLYRVSKNSPIIKALCDAAKNGKSVTVLVELKARFDEQHNILIGKKLERAGCTVIYGVPKLKTHTKITEIRRNEKGKLRTYLHLGTGNYNDVTAQIYSDISLLTCNKRFVMDADSVFNLITMHNNGNNLPEVCEFGEFLVSPYNTKNEIIRRIKSPDTMKIVIKVNGLTDKDIVDALDYAGRVNGTIVDLYVRSTCSLIPTPENGIHIYSVLGQFLEHARVYYFVDKDMNETMYCGSADAMPRNMHRRIEVLFPITGKKNREKIIQMVTNPYPTQNVFELKESQGDYYDESISTVDVVDYHAGMKNMCSFIKKQKKKIQKKEKKKNG